jgi:hypothetical protein
MPKLTSGDDWIGVPYSAIAPLRGTVNWQKGTLAPGKMVIILIINVAPFFNFPSVRAAVTTLDVEPTAFAQPLNSGRRAE